MRRVTLEDVAAEAGVSRALVSLAYRGAPGVSAATRERVLAVGARLGYSPNRAAARLASRGTHTIGVFLQDLRNELFADVHDGLREIADAAGRRLVVAVGEADGSRDAESLDALEGERVDLVVAAGLQLDDESVRRFAQRIPVVSVARRIDGLDAADSDNRRGAGLAVRHLVELGHTRIVFLANPPSDGYLERSHGYVDAMTSAGLRAVVVPSSYVRAQAAADAALLLDRRDPPDAVFAHNDQAALGVLDAMADRRLVPGRDVSVVGYDDSAASRLPGAGLTTIDIHGAALGRAAGELALRRLARPDAAPEARTSVPDLVVRATTGPPAQRSTSVISNE